MAKIKPGQLGGGKIPVTAVAKSHESATARHVSISFKYLDLAHEKFSVRERDSNYMPAVLDRLKAICGMTPEEMRVQNKRALRCHSIEWGDTSEPDGFSRIPVHLRDSCPFQFQFTSNEHGRAHGFFVDSVFFIVWFDPDHQLYP